MRKWIFGLLVLANVVFFAVMHWGGALTVDANNPPLQAALNPDKIKLLSLNASSAPASAVAAASSVAASAVQPASQVAAQTEVAAVPHAAAPVPPAVRTPPAPLAAHASAVPPAQPSPRTKLSCMEWGEFSGPELQRVAKGLSAMKLGKRLKMRFVEYGNAYWVYIPPLKSHAQVEQKIAQLKAFGVGDYFVIQEPGVWQNAISLGVFKTEEAAQKYLDKVHEQGVKSAVLGERASKLKSTVFVLNRLDGSMASHVTAMHKDFPESELKQVPCGG